MGKNKNLFNFYFRPASLPDWQKMLTLGFLGVPSPPPQLRGAKTLERVPPVSAASTQARMAEGPLPLPVWCPCSEARESSFKMALVWIFLAQLTPSLSLAGWLSTPPPHPTETHTHTHTHTHTRVCAAGRQRRFLVSRVSLSLIYQLSVLCLEFPSQSSA